MFAGNLRNLLAGSPRARELAKLHEDWDATQSLWRASPLSTEGTDDLTLKLIRRAFAQAERLPARPIWIGIFEAVDALYRAEEIGAIEPRWAVLEEDAEAVITFRDMMGRRRRWSADFKTLNSAFEQTVIDTLVKFLEHLPEYCFLEWTDEGFEIPLLDLVDRPADMIDALFMLPYADTTFQYDLFKQLLAVCRHNVMIASGFDAERDPREVQDRLIRPPAHKKRDAPNELAEEYLRGSPLRPLLNIPIPFQIPDEARFEHCHIIGGTGHGKTQLLQKMIHADLLASQTDGRSVIVIDSQGDLINKLVRLDLFSLSAENSLADRLVLIDPADIDHPAALNLFDAHISRLGQYTAADRERVLNGVIELYEMFFGAFLGAELTQKQGVIFKYLARLMLIIPGATIHTLMKVMENGRDFQAYIDRLDGSARYFFETEFFAPSFAATRKQVLRRLWGVLSTPAFERMFTQPQNKLDLFEAMNERKIILVSTAKDLLKQEGSQLLGRFYIAMSAQAALERSTLSEFERVPTYLYVDEAQEYFDDNIETILTQARKYRVGITVAHQTLDQLSPRLRSAMFANTSVKCAGGVSAKDARLLADELHTTPAFITGMKRRRDRSEFAVWVKHLTPQAIRLSCPLGFLERQPTLDVQDFAQLIDANQRSYGGAPQKLMWLPPPAKESEPRERTPVAESPPERGPTAAETQRLARTDQLPTAEPEKAKTAGAGLPVAEDVARPDLAVPQTRPTKLQTDVTPAEQSPRDLGKGGRNHRYLQSLVKELAEQHEMRATIEAPISGGGQVDVLIEREGVLAAIEISVSTPVSYETQNVRKCLEAGYPRVALILAKSKRTQSNYIAAITQTLSSDEREKVSFLVPEDLPDFIAALAPSVQSPERVVRGYKVTANVRESSPEEARARRNMVAKLISNALQADR